MGGEREVAVGAGVAAGAAVENAEPIFEHARKPLAQTLHLQQGTVVKHDPGQPDWTTVLDKPLLVAGSVVPGGKWFLERSVQLTALNLFALRRSNRCRNSAGVYSCDVAHVEELK